jgi:uncharacterized protein (TIGR00288 family)
MLKNKRFALLIDADNISASYIKNILQELAKFGYASIRKIYGDWSNEALNQKWKDTFLPYALIPVHQIAYTKKKNATDIGMVIDAMDMLYSDNVDGFAIVTSDSDFTALALRIRMSSKEVIGFGEEKTPNSLVNACDQFIYVENLTSNEFTTATQWNYDDLIADTELIDLLKTSVIKKSNETGYADLSSVGQYLVEVQPNFDPRNFGFATLSKLLKTTRLFEENRSGTSLSVKYLNEGNEITNEPIKPINEPSQLYETIIATDGIPNEKEVKKYLSKLLSTQKHSFHFIATSFKKKFPDVEYKTLGFKKASDYFKDLDYLNVFTENEKLYVELKK